MLISRTGSLLEIAPASGPRLALDIGRIGSVSLKVVRGGRSVAFALLVEHADGSPPVSIAGTAELLAIVHERIAEAMAEVPASIDELSYPTAQDAAWMSA